jgi:3-methyladenine DNA glycosylase AlkD
MKTVISELKKVADVKKAVILSRYFKTGRGEYGEGDIFWGITVPKQRIIAQKYYGQADFTDIAKLLESKVHEHRFTALEMLVLKYETSANEGVRKEIFNFYIKNRGHINNWDLVDTSAPYIVGDYLAYRPRSLLYRLAKSKKSWDRRIAVVSTYLFIKNRDFADTCALVEMLMTDAQPLIHKVCGWMLREVGKKNELKLLEFLNKNHESMPRVMLSYAIERLPRRLKLMYSGKMHGGKRTER